MSETQSDKPVERHELSISERAWAGVGAAVLVGAGGASTFVADNGAGSAALVAAGAVLAVLSITGQSLRRVKVGDAEAEFYTRLGRKTAETAESETADPGARDTARHLLRVVSDTAADVPQDVRRIELAEAYEQSVLSALRRITGDNLSVSGREVDAVVGGEVGIEIKYRQAGRAPGLGVIGPAGLYRAAVDNAARHGLPALLIITNSAVAHAEAVTLEDPGVRVRLLQWNDSMEDTVLRAALEDLAQ